MATQAQIEANRKNAQKSTGPKTPEGKKTVSQNAASHGFFAKNALVRRDDVAEFESYRAAMLTDLAPCGQLETCLADRVIVLMWQLARSVRFQTESLDALVVPVTPKKIGLPMSFDPYIRDDCQESGMSYDEYTELSDQGEEAVMERIDELLKEKQDQENERAQKESDYSSSFGGICIRDFSKHRVLDRLSIYEQRIQKLLFAALHQFEIARRQRKHVTEQSPAQYIVDKVQENS